MFLSSKDKHYTAKIQLSDKEIVEWLVINDTTTIKVNSCSIRLPSLENNSKGIPTKRLRKRKRKYRLNLKLKLVHEVSIQLQLVYKKSKNDYTDPVNLWIVLNIDLAWKLLSVRSVNNVFHKVMSLQHVPKPKFKSGPKQFLFCLNKCEKHITWNI